MNVANNTLSSNRLTERRRQFALGRSLRIRTGFRMSVPSRATVIARVNATGQRTWGTASLATRWGTLDRNFGESQSASIVADAVWMAAPD